MTTNELELAELKAKEIISLAEQKAQLILQSAKNVDAPSNSILEVKLNYIQKDIGEIKNDVKEIKNDYVSRRELNDILKTVREEMKSIRDKGDTTRSILNWILTAFGLSMISAIAKLILKI